MAQVIVYDATRLPEEDGWTKIIQAYQGDRWIEDGWLVQQVEVVQYEPIQFGEDDSYRRDIGHMAGSPTWFLECRMVTDGYASFADVAPCVLAAGGTSGVWYHFTIGSDKIRFFPDIRFEFVFADLEPGVPHVYRLEVRPGSYLVWIDGALIDAGVPLGPYPDPHASVVFGARASGEDSEARWDFLRLGRIPQDGSGDFDSDGIVGQSDIPYFLECVLSRPPADPGCRWADMDSDGDTDAFDVAAFAALLSEPRLEPRPRGPAP